MTFDKISTTTSCNCFENANEDIASTFIRRVSRSENLKDSDFKNHIERGKLPSSDNCNDICGYYGVSIELWDEVSKTDLLEKYLETAKISPQFKKNLCIIKMKPEAGLLKHTPNQAVYNVYHYDFYKDDKFTVSSLELIKMIQLKSE